MTGVEGLEGSVRQLMRGGDGHGFAHVARVRTLALRFARDEGADLEVVELASLLHDVDDYKLVGPECAARLGHATKLLGEHGAAVATTEKVLGIIGAMGYSTYLAGVRPTTLEGQVVSDADMCDAIGAVGIVRAHAFALSRGNEFFDPACPPGRSSPSAEQYRAGSEHSAQHFFDKLLRIPSILMTASGRAEGARREAIMVDFLRELFTEEGASDWLAYLDEFEPRRDAGPTPPFSGTYVHAETHTSC